MKRNQSGFTLIEIAIVLVIIGLLLGGVLKGQELINSAKVKNLAGDFRNVPLFIYGYQDKFKTLPGDDRAVDTHLSGLKPNCPGGTCPIPVANITAGNGVINGLWNSITSTDESYLFWQHVRLAGFAPGTTAVPGTPAHGDGYLPINAVGGEVGIMSGTSTAANSPVKDTAGNAIRGSYIICSSAILGKFAKQLDTQMDDGNTAAGSMMAVPTGSALNTTATPTTGVGGIDDAASYTVCMGI
ncbi:MAG TPA: prepilin-type N-terminal cleavage/methylation domain-containing protein [Gallionellaceae bacterium]|nr:prepilin-type N-terminal cleavage/methylation domain-containing protein [Gallionellaceae bacterium]